MPYRIQISSFPNQRLLTAPVIPTLSPPEFARRLVWLAEKFNEAGNQSCGVLNFGRANIETHGCYTEACHAGFLFLILRDEFQRTESYKYLAQHLCDGFVLGGAAVAHYLGLVFGPSPELIEDAVRYGQPREALAMLAFAPFPVWAHQNPELWMPNPQWQLPKNCVYRHGAEMFSSQGHIAFDKPRGEPPCTPSPNTTGRWPLASARSVPNGLNPPPPFNPL